LEPTLATLELTETQGALQVLRELGDQLVEETIERLWWKFGETEIVFGGIIWILESHFLDLDSEFWVRVLANLLWGTEAGIQEMLSILLVVMPTGPGKKERKYVFKYRIDFITDFKF
jgi:hypothetical protein